MQYLDKKDVADILVEAGCYINVWSSESGIKLPDGSEVSAYLSCRRLISQPEPRQKIEERLAQVMAEEFSEADIAVGLATAGIPWAQAIAMHQHLPMSYVRSGRKAYGVGDLVEGAPKENTRAVLVDDTLYSGKSLIRAIQALKEEKNIETIGVIVIASLFAGSPDEFGKQQGIKVVSLTDYREICDASVSHELLTETQADEMLKYYNTPQLVETT